MEELSRGENGESGFWKEHVGGRASVARKKEFYDCNYCT